MAAEGDEINHNSNADRPKGEYSPGDTLETLENESVVSDQSFEFDSKLATEEINVGIHSSPQPDKMEEINEIQKEAIQNSLDDNPTVEEFVQQNDEYPGEEETTSNDVSSREETTEKQLYTMDAPLPEKPLKFEEMKPFGDIGQEEYDVFFEKAFIKEKWHDKALTDVLAIEGQWKVCLARSESTEGILRALGYGMIKRKAVSSFETVSEIKFLSKPPGEFSLQVKSFFPLKIVKEATFLINSGPFSIQDGDTGKWTVVGTTLNGILVIRYQGPKLIMYESRAILPNDPMKQFSTPMQVFQWTVISRETNELFTAERWLRKLS